jgi:hypothetical protein
MHRFDQYIALSRKIQQSWWVRWALGIWASIAIYDLLLSQYIPAEFSKKAPKAWEVALIAGGLLPWWGWLLILAAIVIVALVQYLVRLRKMPRGDTFDTTAMIGPLDIAEWVNQESYFVWVAACLWKGIKPVPKIDQDHPAYPMLQRIKGALDTGQIESLSGAANMNARVRREELIKLASIHGEKPRFLFPSEALGNFEEEFSAAFNRTLFKDKKGDRNAVLLRLTELRETGVILRNSPMGILLPSDLEKWFRKVDEWTGDVTDALKNLDLADSKWFDTLDTLPPARVAIPNIRMTTEQKRFELIFRSHDLRLVRLNDLLRKHGVGA